MENCVIDVQVRKRMVTANGPMDMVIETKIEMGKLIALFGDSGAGKTTLLRILAGLIVPDEGQIRFGQTVWFDSKRKINLPPQQRNISLMFQDYALFPNMTVAENITFAQPEPNFIEVEKLLHLFGLAELQKRKPSGLSGGQKQRVALARALARKPQLLLLDEPLSSLDAEMRLLLQDEIEKVHRQWGITTVMVSHDLNEVFRLASHVIHLENGMIARIGTPDDVFSNNNISGKVQITGQIARIDYQDVVNIVTVIVGGNQVIKVIAFDSDLENLNIGDRVSVFSKAFNPIICKLN